MMSTTLTWVSCFYEIRHLFEYFKRFSEWFGLKFMSMMIEKKKIFITLFLSPLTKTKFMLCNFIGIFSEWLNGSWELLLNTINLMFLLILEGGHLHLILY
jgi:hypothetical protein